MSAILRRRLAAEVIFPLAVRGFHVYRGVWAPWLGQQLSVEREHSKAEDRFTVAVL